MGIHFFGIGIGILLLILCMYGYFVLKSLSKRQGETEVFTGRDALFGEDHTLISSGLLVFPAENMNSIRVKQYHFSQINGLDSAYEIFLEYQLDKEEFAKEKDRLESIMLSYEGMTHDIARISEADKFHVYVASWSNVYEYAIVDEKNTRIVCVYAQFLNPKQWDFVPDEYKVESSMVQDKLGEEFSIYYFIGKDGSRIVRSQEQGAEIR